MTIRVSKDFKPIIAEIDRLAIARTKSPEEFVTEIDLIIPSLFQKINHIIAQRIEHKIKPILEFQDEGKLNIDHLIKKLELPTQFRSLFNGHKTSRAENISTFNLTETFDQLTFPALAYAIIAAASFFGHHVIHRSRPLIGQMARHIKQAAQPQRILWLTDTFLNDSNGVSSALADVLEKIQEYDLPIDMLVCAEGISSQPHLHVLKPVKEFTLPIFAHQKIRLPDLLAIQDLVLKNGYNRIICSTELLMGPIVLYLKQAFNLPIYFFMHTDWLDYFQKTTDLDIHHFDRLRRTLRSLYKQFDGIFVLNSDHQQWLSSSAMDIPKDNIYLTKHWVKEIFGPNFSRKKIDVFPGVMQADPILLYSGRLSEEKGVLDLPDIYYFLKNHFPNIKLVIAGSGPKQEQLRRLVPEAIFLGWVDREQTPHLYSHADMLVLPSRFDTFGCVVLEAMSCATPVAAYSVKGPKDIIQHGVNGFLATDKESLSQCLYDYFNTPEKHSRFRQQAFLHSKDYHAEKILTQFLEDLKWQESTGQMAPTNPADGFNIENTYVENS